MRDILVMDHEGQETFWSTFKGNNKILFATSFKEGLKILSEKVGLVFLRIGLPYMDGIEVLKQIKKEHPSVAVIIITSCGTEETCIEAFRNGARDYLNKPLEAEEIRQKINLLLNAGQVSQRRQHVSLSTITNPDENYPEIPSHLVGGVLRVRDYVAQNYSESLTLSAACKMATISKTYFCHFFKCITGHSLRSYHHLVKIHIAEELLCDKRLSITDVATRLGYDDPNYFSTIYKKITGFSPREWQASYKDQHKENERTCPAEIACDNKYSQIQSESEYQSLMREWQDSYCSVFREKPVPYYE
jgi:YesN/AraC family two-component response regulator